MKLLAIIAVGCVSAFCQQPVISIIVNNYSGVPPGLPNSGIAQGAIFIVLGENLANSSTGLRSLPLTTTLDGVSMSVTVGGTTTLPILYYVLPNQIAAILPSATPVGSGTLQVTNNGQTGAAPIQVVQSAFGILTLNQAGSGMAVASMADYSLLSFTNAVNPGEAVILWGSGIGPAPGDETQLQQPQNLGNIPVEVDLGGISATVLYRGRSTYPGLDQVNVVVPQGVSPGCYVSVVVRTGQVVSNFATIPVATSGRTCSDPSTGLTAMEIERLFAMDSFVFGKVNVSRTLVQNPETILDAPEITDEAKAFFSRYTPEQFNATTDGQTVSLGSCVVFAFRGNSAFNNPVAVGYLSAGRSINVNTAIASIAATDSAAPVYDYLAGFGASGTGSLPMLFFPENGGSIVVNDGSGGNDIGPFETETTVGTAPIWSNEADLATVHRLQGLTVSWSAELPYDYVEISGTSGIEVGASFTCAAPTNVQTFTVPSTVLIALPASSSISQFFDGAWLAAPG